MNERFRHDLRIDEPGATMVAEGMRRRAFTVAEIEATVRAGIIYEHERFELIGGDILPMSPDALVCVQRPEIRLTLTGRGLLPVSDTDA